jgi:hypothetical protein
MDMMPGKKGVSLNCEQVQMSLNVIVVRAAEKIVVEAANSNALTPKLKRVVTITFLCEH